MFGAFEFLQHNVLNGGKTVPIPFRSFLPRSPNLALDYMAVIGTRPPSQGLKPSDFLKGCEVLAEVATVRHQTQGRCRIKLPEDCHYSKINRLVRITAGSPPGIPRSSHR